ncbi:S58 family peptidase [bacterium]|nr:MAG: S58 family peptidase [bacterium]
MARGARVALACAVLAVGLNAAAARANPYVAAEGVYAKAPALGIRIGTLAAGANDAITDVAGVRVGQITHIEGEGRLRPGAGPVRTGVTAIIPRDDLWHRKVPAAIWALNGNGEMTGAHWVNEAGMLEVPILLTDTLSVGRVDDGVVTWMIRRYPEIGIDDDVPLPVVAECDDQFLDDIQGRHAVAADAVAALDAAAAIPPEQGAVGAGTGMMAFQFKAGIGTASRVISTANGGYTVGVLVNANMGRRPQLLVDGVSVGRALTDLMPKRPTPDGSIIIVLATDAPLDHAELLALARRAALGLARTGATSMPGSGDLVIAFSTANVVPHYPQAATYPMTVLSRYHIDPVFTAAEDATEEAILNALLAAQTMTGRDGNTAYALPHERLRALLAEHR